MYWNIFWKCQLRCLFDCCVFFLQQEQYGNSLVSWSITTLIAEGEKLTGVHGQEWGLLSELPPSRGCSARTPWGFQSSTCWHFPSKMATFKDLEKLKWFAGQGTHTAPQINSQFKQDGGENFSKTKYVSNTSNEGRGRPAAGSGQWTEAEYFPSGWRRTKVSLCRPQHLGKL